MENAKLLRDIAELYYNEDMTQADIARRFGLSRAKICRLLAEAKERGIVKIFITESEENMQSLEEELMKAFSLSAVKVLSVPPDTSELAMQIAASGAAKFIAGLMDDGDVIGVGWGSTLHEVSKRLPSLALTNATVIQLSGNLDNADTSNYALQIAHNFAAKLSARSVYTLPCPAILDNQIIYNILLHDEKIARLIDMVNSCDKMVVNIGVPTAGNCLCRSGYVTDEMLDSLLKSGAIGSICTHFYNRDGQISNKDLDDRTSGVSLANIIRCEHVIACCIGTEKADALYTALQNNFIKMLVVDYATALAIVKRQEEDQAKCG